MTNPSPRTATVYVVDDDPGMRQSVRFLLESVRLPVRDFGSAEEFLQQVTPDCPGCLILDVRMQRISGLELQDLLRRRGYVLPVLVVTAYGDVRIAVRAMQGGAVEFIEKPYNDQHLLDRVQQALACDQAQRQERARRAAVQGQLESLTRRERQVLDRIIKGMSNKQIAVDLTVSDKTVEVHRAHVMRKLGAQNAADLVRIVLSGGNWADAPPAAAGDSPDPLPA